MAVVRPSQMTWKIIKENKESWWRKYYLKAELNENDNIYELIAEFNRPVYMITIYKNKDYSIENSILNIALWSDTKMNTFTKKIMNASRINIERQLKRIENIYFKESENTIESKQY